MNDPVQEKPISTLRILTGLASWFCLIGGVFFGQIRAKRLTEDFELQSGWLDGLLMHQLTPLALLIFGSIATAWILFAQAPRIGVIAWQTTPLLLGLVSIFVLLRPWFEITFGT